MRWGKSGGEGRVEKWLKQCMHMWINEQQQQKEMHAIIKTDKWMWGALSTLWMTQPKMGISGFPCVHKQI
jgi:hypothetical protein